MRDSFLSGLFFQRSEIPDITGYSPSQHRKCVDLSILKKINVYNIEKQRTTIILETEFNRPNKFLGRESMTRALLHGTIVDEQFSRPGRGSIDQNTLKHLFADHRYYAREAYDQASIGLTGNYDRIIHTAAALALLRFGIKHTKTHSMFESVQKMIHRVRTAYGD